MHQVLNRGFDTRMILVNESGESYKTEPLANSNEARISPAAIYLSSKDLVLLISGNSLGKPGASHTPHLVKTVSVHHLAEDRWSMLEQKLNKGRSTASACLAANSIYIIGG